MSAACGPFKTSYLPPQLFAALIFLATMACFSGACANRFVEYDDDRYVTENPRVESGSASGNLAWAFTSPEAANWHPLPWISLQLDAALYGLEPFGFHLTSVLLHATNTLLVFWVFFHMTQAL